jgi:hypothetical protein
MHDPQGTREPNTCHARSCEAHGGRPDAVVMEWRDTEMSGMCRCHRSWETIVTVIRVSCSHGRAAWGSSLRCQTRPSPPS